MTQPDFKDSSEWTRIEDMETIILIPTFVDKQGTHYLDVDNAYTRNSNARWALKKEND